MELWQLHQFQSLPLEAKIAKSKLRIREWMDHFGGDVYVSFSGGKDSTVLLDLVRSEYPGVPAVFSDTGLEFPEIREFVKTVPDVTWVKPDMTFRQVIEKHGYPVISKEQSDWIYRVRCGNPQVYQKNVLGIRPDGRETRFHISEKWRYLLDAPFQIGAGCCAEMKKKPLDRYAKETGRVPILGTMACESALRLQKWLLHGCNAFDNKSLFPCRSRSGWRRTSGNTSTGSTSHIARFTIWGTSGRDVFFVCMASIWSRSRIGSSAFKRRIRSCGGIA